MTTSITNLLTDHGGTLRIGLKEDEVEVAKERECGKSNHEKGGASRFGSVAVLARGDPHVLEEGVGCEEDWAVHGPLTRWVGQREDLEEGDERGQDDQKPLVVRVEV